MNSPFLSGHIYKFLFALLGLVYIIGLFVPLMDSDSAHHANIALHMYLTGDYVTLVDHAGAYLDKPHLHFWLCAFSYKIFGVTTFAYKLPSFLFTILGVYSTYRIGKSLYNAETGKLAALILASSFAFILANNDVRMDAILTACIAFSIWQLVEFIQNKKMLNVAGAAFGLALGFSTKGHIAVFVPAVAALFYIFYRNDLKLFLNWKSLLLVILFGIFIAPVVYCYYLQFNLHPEITVRGKDKINGVKFILLNQSIDRFTGNTGDTSKHDYFFFFHSFLWAFAPWGILAYIAIIRRVKNLIKRKPAISGSGRREWITAGVFLVMLLIVSFSGFKLPHYLNVVFPTTAVLAAAFIFEKRGDEKWVRIIIIIQFVTVLLLLILGAVINTWAFPVKNVWMIAGVIVLLAAVFYFMKSPFNDRLQKAITVSVAAMIFSFFLLNSNFYPQLLKYQGGKEMADAVKGKLNPDDVYFWKNNFSSSFNFYTKTLYRPFNNAPLASGKKTWLIYDIRDEEQIKKEGYQIGQQYSVLDYEITKPDLKFVNPATREKNCTRMMLSEITR